MPNALTCLVQWFGDGSDRDVLPVTFLNLWTALRRVVCF